MCGICGQINFYQNVVVGDISSLLNKINHRGPDDHGIWSSPSAACVFGHARLSIIDLSQLGHQPMLDIETGNCIVYNGEIYNFETLRRHCELAGYRFRSHSDTEVILALYRQHGVDCLQKLRGMFSFALWDESNQKVFFARDRLGKKPFNYALVDGGIIFCSEIDPLSQYPGVSREIDSEALELYLQLQYIPSPWTIYRSIRKLPPAHYGLLDQFGFTIERYWDVDYTNKIVISEQDALDGLEEKLSEAVKLRMISDVPLGALLSGGVDSSLIVALMAKLCGQPVRTFSIGFREQKFNELPFAKKASDICGSLHYSQIMEAPVAEMLPSMTKHYGEPFADSSAVPSFLVSRIAREHVTVAMNGDGGDELLGGYPRYKMSSTQMWMCNQVLNSITPSQFTSYASQLWMVKGIPGKVIRRIASQFWPENQFVNVYNAFWNDDIRLNLLGMHDGSTVLPQWRTSWLNKAMSHADNPIDRMLWNDSNTYLPGDLLVKMDIASMHCGLETRSPLLDHVLIEYCASLQVDFKVHNRTGKYLLKKLAERYFPQEFVHRPKMGFGIPCAVWLKGALRPLLEDTLRNSETMAPFQHSVVTQTLDGFLNHNQDSSSRLWVLLMYGLWHQHYLEAGRCNY